MKTVKLKKFALARYEDSTPFPLGELSIKVEGLPKYEGAEMRFVAKINDSVITRLSLSENSNVATINQDLLDCGEFKAAVIVYSKGVKVEEYNIEPLIITAVDGIFFADPVITNLEKEVQAASGKVESLAKDNAELKGQVENLTKQVESLLTFARESISAIPYINDLKIEEDTKNE
ncbi:MAG: hypothetical protein K2N30_03345 [Clostridia bacterium]|nr:hypothetical protein [Clostridia bacterium]